MDSAIGKLNLGGSFPFAPSTPPIDLSQSGDFADSATSGERLNIRNVSQDLEELPGGRQARRWTRRKSVAKSSLGA